MPELFARSDAPAVATEEMKRDCLRRELIQRKRAYPRFVEQGRMTQAMANHQIWLIERIIEEGFDPRRCGP